MDPVLRGLRELSQQAADNNARSRAPEAMYQSDMATALFRGGTSDDMTIER